MVKSFLILISLQIFLYSSEQIILVVSNSLNSPKATLVCFENGEKIFEKFEVNIGKNGLGWGLGKIQLKQNKIDTLKYEGDKKAPIGIFNLTHLFGYSEQTNLNMPYLNATKELICVDDSNHNNYNQIVPMPDEKPASFEYMKRNDNQYELGVVVEHNKQQVKKRGSCIFIHVQKSKDAPTAGCTSMSLQKMKKIVDWLDESKNPTLIQVPKQELYQIKKLYPELPIK